MKIFSKLLPLILVFIFLQQVNADPLQITLNPMVQEVNQVLSKEHYTRYILGGQVFNVKKGVFLVDCSSYVSHLLKRVEPNAYQQLVEFAGTETPNSLDFYNFFKKLSLNNDSDYWQPINKVKNLKPGDIIVFRYKHLRRRIAGHVMVVMKKPKAMPNKPHSYVVRVSDSSPFRHTNDTRHHSGIGAGSMVLYTNSDGKPLSYSWKLNMGRENTMLIDLGRPITT